MLNRLKDQVRRTLMAYPETRNSDIALTIKIWEEFYGIRDTIQTKQLYDLPREDNVKRIRAKFCEQNKQWAYPTIWKIAQKRGIKEDEWRNVLGYPAAGEIIYPTKISSWTDEMRYKPRKGPGFNGQAALV
jgi:hypothetical protein